MANLITKDKVLDVAAKFIELAGDVKDASAIEHVQTQIAQYRLGLFRIVVVGEVKKGKSSFINALLGEPGLLPTASDVATSTVYKLMYGTSKKIKVFSLPAETDTAPITPAPIEITEAQLGEYGTETGNPNNQRRVDFIGIQVPHPLLKDGVAIIDTPGLGGLFQKHRDITWRYIPNADAVFFVFDSVEAVASKEEMEYLSRLRELSPLIFFVQTKIDLVEESQWKKWRERNLQIISEQLRVPAGKLIYFPVSAKVKFAADANHSPKHLDRSGYSALLYFLYNKLLAKKEDQLGRRLLSALLIEATGIHRKLSDGIQIAATETKEGLDNLERTFIETKTKYEQWKASDFHDAVTTFQDKATELKRKTREALQERLDPSPYSPLISTIVSQLREASFDPQQMNEKADTILATCVDKCSQIVLDVQGHYNDQMHEILNEFSTKLGKTLRVQVQTPISGPALTPVGSLHMIFDIWETTTNVFYGGMAGFVMSNVALMALHVASGGTTLILHALASLAGLKWKSDALAKRRQEEALLRLQNVLSDTVRRALSQGMRQFDSIAAEYDKGVRDSLHTATAEVENEIAGKMESISEQRQRSREDAKQKTEALRQMLERTDGVLRHLGRITAAGKEDS